jgi:hypothetical protein
LLIRVIHFRHASTTKSQYFEHLLFPFFSGFLILVSGVYHTMPYHPPLTLTPLLIDLVSRISEQLGRWAAVEGEISPRLRRENRIRSIQASLAIEKRIEFIHPFSDGNGRTGSIKDASGELHRSGDIILRGVSGISGHKVCRVIETGETMGPPDR